VDELPSAAVWNRILEQERAREGQVAWFESSWMLVECYMYRRSLPHSTYGLLACFSLHMCRRVA